MAGAPLFGVLEYGHIGEQVPCTETVSTEELEGDCLRNNTALLEHLREDVNEEELMWLTAVDAQLGRMSKPVPAAQCDLNRVRLHPRFGVEQGLRRVACICGIWRACCRCSRQEGRDREGQTGGPLFLQHQR